MKKTIYSICTMLCIVLSIKGFGQCSTASTPTCVSNQGYQIISVSMGLTSQTSGTVGPTGYTNSTSKSFTLVSGASEPIYLYGASPYQYSYAVFIDLNQDNMYSASELIMSSTGTTNAGGNVQIPFVSSTGTPYKMRVRANYVVSTGPIPDACSNYTVAGETEDFTVYFSCPTSWDNILYPLTFQALGENYNRNKVCNNSGFLTVNTNSAIATYTWIPSGISNTNLLISSTNNSSQTYTLVASMLGCPTITNSVSRTFSVLPTPTISVSGNTIICIGNSTTLTGSGATTFSWVHLGGVMNPVVVTPTATTVYTVTGIENEIDFPLNQAFTGCKHTLYTTVQVVTGPTITVSNATICAGSSHTFSPTGATSYTYSSGSAVVSPTAATTVYTITGSNGTCSSSKNATITTIALPSVNVNGGAICLGNSFTISPTGASSYTYSSGSAIVTPTTTTVYSVTGTTGSCSQTKTLTVVTDIAPTDGYSISPLIPTFACAPSKTVTIISVFSSTASVSSYSTSYWLPNTWPSSASGYGNIALTAPTTFTLHTMKNGNSCAKIYTVTVDIAPVVTIAITPTAQTVCNGTPVILTASGADTYSWNNSVSNGVAFTPTVTKTYVATGTNTTTGCIATKNVTITVNPSPTVQLYTSNTSLMLCNGQSMTIDLFGALSYTLVNTSQASGGNNTFTVSPTTTTTYIIIGESSYGCVSSAPPLTVTVTTCTGIDEVTNNNTLSIYPNPANNFITVELMDEVLEGKTISIINALGEVVFIENVTSTNVILNTSHLNSGVYFVQVESKQRTISKKIIKN